MSPNLIIDGVCPLNLAIEVGYMQMVKMLIKGGANLHMPDAPRAPVLQSAMYGRADILELLIGAKCDPNVRNEWQQTGLHLLAHQQGQRFVQCARVFIEKGCDVNARDVNGMTALHTASLEIAEILLQSPSLNVNAEADNGDTPLLSAIKSRRFDVAKFLVASGHSDLDKADRMLMTPLINLIDLAVSSDPQAVQELAELLLKHGASSLRIDKHGQIALHHACYIGAERLVRLLIRDLERLSLAALANATPFASAAAASAAAMEHTPDERTQSAASASASASTSAAAPAAPDETQAAVEKGDCAEGSSSRHNEPSQSHALALLIPRAAAAVDGAFEATGVATATATASTTAPAAARCEYGAAIAPYDAQAAASACLTPLHALEQSQLQAGSELLDSLASASARAKCAVQKSVSHSQLDSDRVDCGGALDSAPSSQVVRQHSEHGPRNLHAVVNVHLPLSFVPNALTIRAGRVSSSICGLGAFHDALVNTSLSGGCRTCGCCGQPKRSHASSGNSLHRIAPYYVEPPAATTSDSEETRGPLLPPPPSLPDAHPLPLMSRSEMEALHSLSPSAQLQLQESTPTPSQTQQRHQSCALALGDAYASTLPKTTQTPCCSLRHSPSRCPEHSTQAQARGSSQALSPVAASGARGALFTNSINLQDRYGRTPFFIATSRNHRYLVRAPNRATWLTYIHIHTYTHTVHIRVHRILYSIQKEFYSTSSRTSMSTQL